MIKDINWTWTGLPLDNCKIFLLYLPLAGLLNPTVAPPWLHGLRSLKVLKHGGDVVYLTDQSTELRLLNMVRVLKEVDMMLMILKLPLMKVHSSLKFLSLCQQELCSDCMCSVRHDSADQTGADTAHRVDTLQSPVTITLTSALQSLIL